MYYSESFEKDVDVNIYIYLKGYAGVRHLLYPIRKDTVFLTKFMHFYLGRVRFWINIGYCIYYFGESEFLKDIVWIKIHG
ncbi:MAG: hypothetical protein QW803_08950 [Candidatus Methanomethylicia archaeon]